MTNQDPIIACRECDLLQREVTPPLHGEAQCVRCGAELFRNKPASLDHTLAFLGAAASLAATSALPLRRASAEPVAADAALQQQAPFALEEKTIVELSAGMKSGEWSARDLVQQYLGRIDALDRRGPMLRHVLETNPDALSIADALDANRQPGEACDSEA